MPAAPFRIQPRHELTALEIEDLEDKLYAYNVQATGYDDGEWLGFTAEENGERVGAAAGYTWGGICELRQVWVREDRRGSGLGRALIIAAIEEAERRGCRRLLLTTYDFQAPGFYRRLGFEEAARVPDKPLGHTEFIMVLELTPRR
jgi:GNAT superfamily N-acetyltransferase